MFAFNLYKFMILKPTQFSHWTYRKKYVGLNLNVYRKEEISIFKQPKCNHTLMLITPDILVLFINIAGCHTLGLLR
jgi:hypothetical protein